jgi:hypothetical protein
MKFELKALERESRFTRERARPHGVQPISTTPWRTANTSACNLK